jgi:hypothetical protein
MKWFRKRTSTRRTHICICPLPVDMYLDTVGCGQWCEKVGDLFGVSKTLNGSLAKGRTDAVVSSHIYRTHLIYWSLYHSLTSVRSRKATMLSMWVMADRSCASLSSL